MKQHEEGLRQWSENTQHEHESERNHPGRNNKRKGKKAKRMTEVNEKIDESAMISRCRNKTDNISPSE